MTSHSAINLLASADTRYRLRQHRVEDPEIPAVSAFEIDLAAQVGVDTVEVMGVDRQAMLVLLTSDRHHAKAQLTHVYSEGFVE